MTVYGYFLSSEEFTPRDLLDQARRAEEAGFEALAISDHFHPWNDAQGQSSFVWSVIGALSQVTSLPITTLVTCPTVRMHPAINAQAAATAAVLSTGGFRFGLGSGEALNEHILGCLACRGRAPGHAGGGRRGDQEALHRRTDHPPR
jgi:G6PDH family F420-dependent oxidoreductase